MDITYYECPVCLEILQKPIMMCSTGHSFCTACHQGLTECSICKSSLTATRNFQLEAILEKSSIKCKNEECTEIHSSDAYNDHLLHCKYNKIACIVPDCDWKGTAIHLNEHFEDAHHEQIIDGGVSINQLQNCIIKFDEFYFYVSRHESNGGYFWIVQHLSPLEECDFTFNYTITFKRDTKEIKIDQSCYLYLEKFNAGGVTDQVMVPIRMLDRYEATIFVEPIFS